MTSMLERAKYELNLAGYRLEPVPESNWTEDDYVQSIGNCAYELVETFCKQEHSGMSAGFCIGLLEKLLRGDILSPLTNDPEEWVSVAEEWGEDTPNKYQSKRKFSCFSDDGLKTYYDIEEECNRNWKLDENGERTGWSSLKSRDQLTYHELKSKADLDSN